MMTLNRPAATLASVAGALALLPSAAFSAQRPAPLNPAGKPRLLIVLLPGALPGGAPQQSPFERIAAQPALSIGLSSATQGRYIAKQALLDISQGTRVSLSAYRPELPNQLLLVADNGGGYFQGWMEINRRAANAPAALRPGLLAQSVPGGAAYVGVGVAAVDDAIVAADRAGRVARVSLGSSTTVAERAQRLLAEKSLVVVSLPRGRPGDQALDKLVAARPPRELLIVMRSPPRLRAAQLLPVGIAGLGSPGTLTSSTTHQDGLIAGIDLLPTALDWLSIGVPNDVNGQPIENLPGRDPDALLALKARLQVVGQRRFPALWALLGGSLMLTLSAMLIADRRGLRWSMRSGALAVFWLPSMLLVTAAISPSLTVEILTVVLASLLLGAASDRLIGWPRAPALPAAVAVSAYLLDLAFGSPLIIRSLLGPNPLFGSRFYGIGNELEALLPALALIGLAALCYGRGRSRQAAAVFAAVGLLLVVTFGWARLGADVGGVMTVAAGFGVATVLMLPGRLTARPIVLLVLSPLVALLALAALDLLTGGDSHFTRTVLRADGAAAWWQIFVRRFELAGRGLIRGLMPIAALIAALTVALGIVRRDRVLAPVDGDASWRAGLAGAAAVGVFGALFNDSGPMLLLFATFIALCGVIYLRGDARLADPAAR